MGAAYGVANRQLTGASGLKIMRCETLTNACRAAGFGLLVLLMAIGFARAEGDSPFNPGNSQDFDNSYVRYKSNQGVWSNFETENYGTSPFNDRGGLKFDNRRFSRPGKGANEYEDGRTGIHLDFNF